MSIFGFGRLLDSSATMTVQVLSAGDQTASGGTNELFATETTGVGVMVTQNQAVRDGSYNTDAQRESFTFTGVDEVLRSARMRLYCTACAALPHLVGKYFRVARTVAQPPGQGGLLDERIEISAQMFDLPVDY